MRQAALGGKHGVLIPHDWLFPGQSITDRISTRQLHRAVQEPAEVAGIRRRVSPHPLRPMSNNREVEYDWDAWFFADDTALMVAHINSDPEASLSYQGSSGVLRLRPFFEAVEGEAFLVPEKSLFAKHWTKGLERW